MYLYGDERERRVDPGWMEIGTTHTHEEHGIGI